MDLLIMLLMGAKLECIAKQQHLCVIIIVVIEELKWAKQWSETNKQYMKRLKNYADRSKEIVILDKVWPDFT